MILNLWEVEQSSNTILVFLVLFMKVKEINGTWRIMANWMKELHNYGMIAHMQNVFFHFNV